MTANTIFKKLGTLRFDLGPACVGMFATLPQAVAYGLIALYPLGPKWASFGIAASIGSAILFGVISGFLGSNRFLISGPRAVTALVLASAIHIALDRGSSPADALVIAFVAVFGAGIFQLIAGNLRLGHAVSYVPDPVLSGFVNASAILVILGTIPTALGSTASSIAGLFENHDGNIISFALVVSGMTVLGHFAAGNRIRFMPAATCGLIVGTAVYYIGVSFFPLPKAPLVGIIEISSLWHKPILFDISSIINTLVDNIDIALASALTIGLLASFDTVISSRAIDSRTGQHSNVNAELRLHGILNAVMGFIGFLPGSGALSRSLAIVDAKARTRTANAGSAIIFALSLIIFAPVVAALPLWATAGMLIAVALQAIDRMTIDKAWKLITKRQLYQRVILGDVLIGIFVVGVALLFDLAMAVCAGVLVSVVLFVLGMSKSPVRRSYRGSRVHSRILRKATSIQWLEKEGDRIGIIELQGALFFGSCARLRSEALHLLENGVEYLILDFRHATSIDSTGAATLRALHLHCLKSGKQLFVSYIEPEHRIGRLQNNNDNPDHPSNHRHGKIQPRWIWLTLYANGVIQTLGKKNFFDDTDTALGHCEELLLRRFGKQSHSGRRGLFANSLLLKGMTREQIATLGRMTKRQRFTKGDIVFSQDDECDRAYFLVYGRVDVLINVPGTARKKRINTFTEGTMFGEFAVLDGAPRSATIIAATNTLCLSIERTEFTTLRKAHQDVVTILLLNLSKVFAGRLRLANIMMSELEQ
ncbi:SLC26A/SulP transporter family protein [Thalassospira alkalitolerans]|uniref:SLC26A/SulP transporter family protein n=1 Tax=Thalassospira alkalitolerans TaxID=1293890 RepID=UPI0030ED762A